MYYLGLKDGYMPAFQFMPREMALVAEQLAPDDLDDRDADLIFAMRAAFAAAAEHGKEAEKRP